jgi:hypothetical protein
MQSKVKDAGLDDLVVKVTCGDKSKTVTLIGGNESIPSPTMFEIDGLFFDITYGPKIINLPFKVGCSDFRLERYPGSNVASSYESDLEIIDEQKNYNRKQTVFMNNVMDYRGYRFFQSAYFPDESGTKLSVNFDALGTLITYIGYSLMALGMIVSLFMKNGRMRELIRKLGKNHDRKVKLQETTLAIALLFSVSVFGQTSDGEDHSGHDHSQHDHSAHSHSDQAPPADQAPKDPVFRVMSEGISEEAGSLLLFNFRDRIIPFHTFATELLRKVHRSDKYEDYNAVKTVVSMHMYPDYWIRQDVIYIESKGGIRDRFKGRSHVSLLDLMDQNTGEFIFMKEYQKAHQKREADRNEFEKKLLKIAERYSIVSDVTAWRLMKIVPSQTDPSSRWFVPLSPELAGADTLGSSLALRFFTEVNNSSLSNSDKEALALLKEFKAYQRRVAGDACPSEDNVAMEIRYNKMNIFKNAQNIYGAIGGLILIVFLRFLMTMLG